MERRDLYSMTVEELEDFVEELGERRYRGRQIADWLYDKLVDDVFLMTNLPKNFRSKLSEVSFVSKIEKVKIVGEWGDTQKYIFKLKDGYLIESALISFEDHLTLCISTQLGCRWGCIFCKSGSKGFIRNLTLSEMVNQIIQVMLDVREKKKNIYSIVFMGIGEPLDNFDEVRRLLKLLTSEYAFCFSPRRITISTCGYIPGLQRLSLEFPKVNLAVSLNAPNDEIRNYLMPINRKYPMKELKEVLKKYPLPPRKKITIEYVMIKDINDKEAHAKELAKFLKGLPVKINLIPYNEIPEFEFKTPTEESIKKFQKILIDKNFTVTIRKSRGFKVSAACGQLSINHEI